MNHNVKIDIGPSEVMFIVKEEDIPDRMQEALKKAESKGAIIDGCSAVKCELIEKDEEYVV